MEDYFKKNSKEISWELLLNKYINLTGDKFFSLKEQTFRWVNINFQGDFRKANKLFKS